MNSNDTDKDSFVGLKASELEFNKKCRRISIKNIPAGVLNQDILELLKPFFYQQIHIDKNSQSCKAVLLDGISAQRCIDDLNGKLFRGQRLSVSLASCDFMLCVTQLPLTFNCDQFLNLITPFGTPERCFLVHSGKTGKSLGYGCVEFTSKESSIKAKNQLNGFQVQNNTLQVHWLDTIPTEYTGLYSRSLLIEDLPMKFNDSMALMKIFSKYHCPKFCQLAGCEMSNFGIVEYNESNEAEESWTKLNTYCIGSDQLKVSFCVPGPCGLVVLNALKASRDLKRDNPLGGLLPTPMPVVENSVQQNSHFVNGSAFMPFRKDFHNEAMPVSYNDYDPACSYYYPKLSYFGEAACEAFISYAQEFTTSLAAVPLQSSITERASHLLKMQSNNTLADSQQRFINNLKMPCVDNSWNQNNIHAAGLAGNLFSSMEGRQPTTVRKRSGSLSSGDSGPRPEDEVFEPMRHRNKEDMLVYDNHCGIMPLSANLNDHSIFNCHRPEKMKISDENDNSQFPQHPTGLIRSLSTCNPQHGNPLLFLREDSQRSESTDSAYGGSQGSNSSETSTMSGGGLMVEQRPTTTINCNHHHHGNHRPPAPNNHVFPKCHPMSNQANGMEPSDHHHPNNNHCNQQPPRTMLPSNGPPHHNNNMHSQCLLRNALHPQTSEPGGGGMVGMYHHGSSGDIMQQATVNQQQQHHHRMNGGDGGIRMNGGGDGGMLHRGGSSAFTNIMSQPRNAQQLLPQPDFTQRDHDFTKVVPVALLNDNNHHHKTSLTGFNSLANAMEGKNAVGIPRGGGGLRRSFTTPMSSLGKELGADSPTQLLLLGSNLVEGLLGGDSSPAHCDASGATSGAASVRLIRALNLFSPTENMNSPQTPALKKRGGMVGECVLPSPEPSPEAGAYVGQHSQGIGGHYADSFGLAGDLFGSLGSDKLSSSAISKRRRSNET